MNSKHAHVPWWKWLAGAALAFIAVACLQDLFFSAWPGDKSASLMVLFFDFIFALLLFDRKPQ